MVVFFCMPHPKQKVSPRNRKNNIYSSAYINARLPLGVSNSI